jgi:hypothetical protein
MPWAGAHAASTHWQEVWDIAAHSEFALGHPETAIRLLDKLLAGNPGHGPAIALKQSCLAAADAAAN